MTQLEELLWRPEPPIPGQILLEGVVQGWHSAFAVLGAEETSEGRSIFVVGRLDRLQVLFEGLLGVH